MQKVERFQFSPEILRRLGEELVPHPDQGIVELVRNSYDADATRCRVELASTQAVGGTVRITDNGNGMDEDAIRSGWLILGKSPKRGIELTPGGRVPVGEKGLGRLSALRMGRKAVLLSRPKTQPGTEHRVEVNWDRYDDALTVESVPLQIETHPTTARHGTTIEVSELRVMFDKRDVERLSRALLLLADPFEHELGFRPELAGTGFPELEKRVLRSYFDDADYRLNATLSPSGQVRAETFDGQGRSRSSTDRLRRQPYRAVEATFELWVFLLDQTRFSRRAPTRRPELKQWLTVMGGVHLYYRNLRVHPYGDPGHDWLEMNLSRAQSPEERPSTNNSVGRVVILDPSSQLTQKTDRSGFIENEAFQELRRFGMDALDWMARERVKERERRKEVEKKTVGRGVAVARATLEQAVNAVPAKARDDVRRAVRRLEGAREREVRLLREDVQLYRTLGTVGTTTAVFAHEAAKPATQIEKMIAVVESRGRAALGADFDARLGQPVTLVQRAAKTLRTFAAFPLRLLQHEKRRSGLVDVNAVVTDMHELFAPFLIDSGIKSEVLLVDAKPRIRGTIASLEAIISNLVINSINALNTPGWSGRRREIGIRTEVSGQSVLLRVVDSGPGIAGISIDEIWLPGRTTIAGGTGLGLTIVRDAAADLGGDSHAISHGELGGAEFVVDLPLATEGG